MASPHLMGATTDILRRRYSLERSYDHTGLVVRDLLALPDIRIVADKTYCEVLLAIGVRPSNVVHLGAYVLGNAAQHADIGIVEGTSITG